MFEGKLTKPVKNEICCKTCFKEGNIKMTLCTFDNNKMGSNEVFMLSDLWRSLSTRKILQAYLLMRKSCNVLGQAKQMGSRTEATVVWNNSLEDFTMHFILL